ncbi:MAG: hypothetical protein MZV64_04060 [Ignavibacteriales bacterium]|nr:hypothetical protein [Ignavibacteriales bacterium]
MNEALVGFSRTPWRQTARHERCAFPERTGCRGPRPPALHQYRQADDRYEPPALHRAGVVQNAGRDGASSSRIFRKPLKTRSKWPDKVEMFNLNRDPDHA